MKRFYLLIALAIISLGFVPPEPPKIVDKSTYEYVRMLRNNLNKPQVSTSNPSSVRLGDYGELLIYKNGSDFYLMVNVSSPNGTTWKGVQIQDVP